MSEGHTPTDAEEAELRELLKPRKRPPVLKQSNLWLGRHIVMTQKDIDAFLRAVRARYPETVFFEDRYFHGGGEGLHLVEQPSANTGFVTGVVPQDGWDPVAFSALDQKEQLRVGRPWTEFQFSVNTRIYDHKFEFGRGFKTLRHGELRGTYPRADREILRFVRSIMWISSKVTTNKLQCLHWQTGEPRWPRVSGSYCGFDALRWCQESPHRSLDGEYRPTDGWRMPDSPWYD